MIISYKRYMPHLVTFMPLESIPDVILCCMHPLRKTGSDQQGPDLRKDLAWLIRWWW